MPLCALFIHDLPNSRRVYGSIRRGILEKRQFTVFTSTADAQSSRLTPPLLRLLALCCFVVRAGDRCRGATSGPHFTLLQPWFANKKSVYSNIIPQRHGEQMNNKTRWIDRMGMEWGETWATGKSLRTFAGCGSWSKRRYNVRGLSLAVTEAYFFFCIKERLDREWEAEQTRGCGGWVT